MIYLTSVVSYGCMQTLTTVLCKAPFTLEIYFEICERGIALQLLYALIFVIIICH